MTEKFIPAVKNPPAKVKDAGLVKMAMDGACVYNAKSGEIILLPKGMELKHGAAARLTAAFFDQCGSQFVGLSGEEAAASLAERYVREYGDQALSWGWSEGRKLSFCGWAAASDKVQAKAASAESALKSVLAEWLGDFSLCRVVEPGREFSLKAVSRTGKGALASAPGFCCSACGAVFEPDSVCAAPVHPVGEGKAEEALAEVHTPGAHTIPLLCEQLGLEITNTLKAMLYTVLKPDGGRELLFAMIRGDKDISIPKLEAYVKKLFPGAAFRRAEAEEIISSFGEVAGFCGPVGVPENVKMVADLSLVGGKNFVVGGNRPDYHRTGCCWGRDFEPPAADLALYEAASPCPQCGGGLEETQLRTIASINIIDAALSGGYVISSRDREGSHSWPFQWKAEIDLESLLLALYENGKKDKI